MGVSATACMNTFRLFLQLLAVAHITDASCGNVQGKFLKDVECFTDAQGADYRGNVAKTVEGLACLSWAVKKKNGGGDATAWPAEKRNGVGNHNYCRNPDSEHSPWCYTVVKGDSKVGRGGLWNFCDVGSPAKSCEGTWLVHA